jgi:hypothetical protein
MEAVCAAPAVVTQGAGLFASIRAAPAVETACTVPPATGPIYAEILEQVARRHLGAAGLLPVWVRNADAPMLLVTGSKRG